MHCALEGDFKYVEHSHIAYKNKTLMIIPIGSWCLEFLLKILQEAEKDASFLPSECSNATLRHYIDSYHISVAAGTASESRCPFLS